MCCVQGFESICLDMLKQYPSFHSEIQLHYPLYPNHHDILAGPRHSYTHSEAKLTDNNHSDIIYILHFLSKFNCTIMPANNLLPCNMFIQKRHSCCHPGAQHCTHTITVCRPALVPGLRSTFSRDWTVVTVVTMVPSGMMVRSTSTFLVGVSEERSSKALWALGGSSDSTYSSCEQ